MLLSVAGMEATGEAPRRQNGLEMLFTLRIRLSQTEELTNFQLRT